MPPPLEVLDLIDRAVMWPRVGYARSGRPVVSQTGRDELRVRWVERRREMQDPNGNTIIVDVQIATDRQLTHGSIVWLGTEASIAGTVPAYTPTADLYVVVATATAKRIDGKYVRYEAGLARHNGVLPIGTQGA